MRSGLARSVCCALIAVVASCEPFSYGERAQLALGDGGIAVDDAVVSVDDTPPPPIDSPIEGPADAPIEGPADAPIEGPVDAPTEAGPDAMIDAPPIAPDAMIDAPPIAPDAMIDAPPTPTVDAGIDAAPPTDGGPGDGSLTDALEPDGLRPPGLPVGGSNGDEIKSFYACSTGDGASALPLLLAILALRRRRR